MSAWRAKDKQEAPSEGPWRARRIGVAAVCSVFVCAVVVRLVVGVATAEEYYYGTMTFKAVSAAINIGRGRGAVWQEGTVRAEQHTQMRLLSPREYAGRMSGAFHPYIQHPPGYAYFLAMCFRLSRSFIVPRVLQAGIDSLCAALLFMLLRRYGFTASLLGGLLYATNLELARNSVAILPDSLVPACILSASAFMWAAYRTGRDALITAAVLPLAVGCYLRGEILLLFPFWLLAFLVGRGWSRRRVLMCIGSVVILLICIVPLALRNYRLEGRLSPSCSNGGFVLYAGLGEIENDHGYSFRDVDISAKLAEKGLAPYTPQANRYLVSEYVRAWRKRPAYVAKSIAARLIRLFFQYGSPGINYPLAHYFARLWRLLVVTCSLVYVMLAFRAWREHIILLSPLIYAMGVFFFMHYEPRHGFGTLHVFCIYSSLAFALLLKIKCFVTTAAEAILGDPREVEAPSPGTDCSNR